MFYRGEDSAGVHHRDDHLQIALASLVASAVDHWEDLPVERKIEHTGADHPCDLRRLSGVTDREAGVRLEGSVVEVVDAEEAATEIGTMIGGATDRGATRQAEAGVHHRGDGGVRVGPRHPGGEITVPGAVVEAGGGVRVTRAMGVGVGVGAGAGGESGVGIWNEAKARVYDTGQAD